MLFHWGIYFLKFYYFDCHCLLISVLKAYVTRQIPL
jgi:hypothetical protein